MDNKFARLQLLVGDDALSRLSATRVIIFGVGGVGAWTAESLIRSGIKHLTIVDVDRIDSTNINRQMPATTKTVGMVKTEVVRNRLLEINPDAEIIARHEFYTAETADSFNLDEFDYVIDAIDTLSDKALLILRATRSRARLFSSMGAALKLDPTKISVTEFWKVQGCPLAAALRRKFKKSGEFPARKFKAVYSPEIYNNRGKYSVNQTTSSESNFSSVSLAKKKPIVNGTIAHTTAIFGFFLAGLVVEDIISS